MVTDTPAVTNSQDSAARARPAAHGSAPGRGRRGSGQIGGWLLRTPGRAGARRGRHLCQRALPGPGPPRRGRPEVRGRLGPGPGARRRLLPGRFTWVDGCEPNPKRAFASNCEQPLNLAQAAAAAGAASSPSRRITCSTATTGPTPKIRPLIPSRFTAGPSARPSWSWRAPGRPAAHDAHFLGLRARAAGQELRLSIAQEPGREATDGLPRGPGFQPQLRARRGLAAVWLAEQQASGLIHLAGPEVMDRVRFAREIALAFGHDTRPDRGEADLRAGTGSAPPAQGGTADRPAGGPLSGQDASAGRRAGRFPFQAPRPGAPRVASSRRRVPAGLIHVPDSTPGHDPEASSLGCD